jgi:hypothetical protein
MTMQSSTSVRSARDAGMNDGRIDRKYANASTYPHYTVTRHNNNQPHTLAHRTCTGSGSECSREQRSRVGASRDS